MDQALKQRLVGAVVLVALAVILLPALFNGGRPNELETLKEIPDMPEIKPIEVKKPVKVADLKKDSKPISQMYDLDPEENTVIDEKPDPSEKLNAKLKESGAPQAWVVQVGSFSDKAKAVKLKESLQKDGYKAFVRSVKKDGKTINRVMIGPKLDKQQALKIKQAVDKKHKLKTLVISFDP